MFILIDVFDYLYEEIGVLCVIFDLNLDLGFVYLLFIVFYNVLYNILYWVVVVNNILSFWIESFV